MQFSYTNSFSELKKLASDIEVFAETYKIPPKPIYALNLCLDEVITNIISYGFKEKPKDSTIQLDLSLHNNQITAVVSDLGIPFNPLTQASPDTISSLENRDIGGLGLYFLDQYMDKVEYKRKDDHNILTLIKNI